MNLKKLHSFLGLVNYFNDMWPRCPHTHAPLMALTGKAPFFWTTDHQTTFNYMKALITSDALLAYPDHSQPFHIEMDESGYQVGVVIKQNNCPFTFYSHKLTPAHCNYTK